MLTADGEPIVIHDNNVKRTSNGQGEVGLMDYAAIQQLDAGLWFGTQFAGERIPHLTEVFNCLQQLNLGANIEIKPYPGKDRQTAITTIKQVQQHWPSTLPPPLISSFSLECLRAVRKIDNKVLLGLLLHHWQEDCKAWQMS